MACCLPGRARVFRAVERTVLVEQIGSRHVVVATGGGTFVILRTALINAQRVGMADVPRRLIARVPPTATAAAADRLELNGSTRSAAPRTPKRIIASTLPPASRPSSTSSSTGSKPKAKTHAPPRADRYPRELGR